MARAVHKCAKPKEPRASARAASQQKESGLHANDICSSGGTSHKHVGDCRCRRALMRWLEKGGPVPPRLAAHLSRCEPCWQWASRMARVQNALTMLATESAPVGLLGRANNKALRMLARQLREGKKAERLRTAKPDAPLWTRLEGPLTRQASAAAAAMIILALRAGINEGIDQVHDWAQPLAQTHFERHIDDQGLLL